MATNTVQKKFIFMFTFLYLTHLLSFAEDANKEMQWFVNLVTQNQGKAFCAQPTTTVKDLANAWLKYAQKHPEFHDSMNSDQVLQGLAETYPCPKNASPIESQNGGLSSAKNIDAYRQKGFSVKTITPIYSQLLEMSLPAGFQASAVYEANLPGQRYMKETVLEGESEKEWTQMITITGVKDQASNLNLTPQKFVENIAGGYKKACPDTFSVVGVPVGKISDFEAFSAIVSCGMSPLTVGKTSESAMIMAIKGQHDYYTVQWAERATPSKLPIPIDTAKWIANFKKLIPIKLCPIVPGESAPYPSCVDAK
jgi:hypothetical protein